MAEQRPDRSGNGEPVGTEDFAQVFHICPETGYEHASYRKIAEVLWAEIETVERVSGIWNNGKAIESISPKTVEPIKKLLRHITLVSETSNKV